MLGDIPQCSVYLDDVIFTDKWDDHIAVLKSGFERLGSAKLPINVVKCEFIKANVTC